MNEMSEELAAILDLPKVELHTHYEGAAPPAFIRGLAQEKNVDLSRVFCRSCASTKPRQRFCKHLKTLNVWAWLSWKKPRAMA